MEEECLSLTWNSHGATYQEMLNLLRIKNILTDCTLACDGQKFLVHRLVLVTCSDFFKLLLEDVTCHHPIIYLRGVSSMEMQTLIDFMYLGKIDVPQKAVPNLISTAETLQIKGLGVLKANTDTDKVDPKENRKKSSPLSPKSLEFSSQINRYSPSRKRGAYKSPDRDYSPPDKKTSKYSLFAEAITEQEYIQRSFEEGISLSQIKEKSESLTQLLGNENSLSSMFKSATSSVPISSSDSTSTTVNSYSVSSDKSSQKESLTLTELTALQPLPQKYMKTINDYYAMGGQSSAMKLNSLAYLEEEGNHTIVGLKNLVAVKEEALDYTRNSALEASESASLSSGCQEGSNLDRFPIENTNTTMNLSRNSFQQSIYSQDENLNVENGTDLGRPHLCPICRKSFAKVAILKRHHMAHFRPYNCHLCPRSFTRREVLAEHVLEHNGADLRLPCPVCKMTIKRKRNLQAHIKVKHPEYHRLKSANNEALF